MLQIPCIILIPRSLSKQSINSGNHALLQCMITLLEYYIKTYWINNLLTVLLKYINLHVFNGLLKIMLVFPEYLFTKCKHNNSMHYAEYYSSKISSPLLHDDINGTQTYSRIINTLIEHTSNKNFTLMSFIMEHNISIMGSMKSIVDKNFGKFQ